MGEGEKLPAWFPPSRQWGLGSVCWRQAWPVSLSEYKMTWQLMDWAWIIHKQLKRFLCFIHICLFKTQQKTQGEKKCSAPKTSKFRLVGRRGQLCPFIQQGHYRNIFLHFRFKSSPLILLVIAGCLPATTRSVFPECGPQNTSLVSEVVCLRVKQL